MKKRFEEYFRGAKVSIDILCNNFIRDKIMQYNMAIMMLAHDHCYAVLKKKQRWSFVFEINVSNYNNKWSNDHHPQVNISFILLIREKCLYGTSSNNLESMIYDNLFCEFSF